MNSQKLDSIGSKRIHRMSTGSLSSIRSVWSQGSIKETPFIISPFMPIATQISVDHRPEAKKRTPGYGSTENKLLDTSDESGSEEGSDSSSSSDSKKMGFVDVLKSLSNTETLRFCILCVAQLVSTVAFSCIAPFFPAEAAMKKLSEAQIGIIFGVFECVMFLTSPIFGHYIVEIGSKRLFVFGLFTTGLTAILFGFLNYLPEGDIFFWASMIVRILEALGDAAFVTASFAIAAKSFPHNIGIIVGILETFAGLGFSIGPVLGGLLYDIGGFMMPFIILGGAMLLASLLACILIEKAEDQKRVSDEKGMTDLLKLSKTWIMLISVAASSCTLSFLDPTLSAHLGSFKLSPSMIGLVFLVSGGAYTISSPPLGSFVDKNGGTISFLIFLGSIGSIIGMLLIGPSPLLGDYFEKNLVLICICLFILGISGSLLYIPCFQGCVEVAFEHDFADNYHTYGSVSGVVQSAFSFGSFIGPAIGSMFVERIGFPWTTTIIAGLNFVLLIFLGLRHVAKKCID